MNTRIKRERVIASKTSVETLAELNREALKMDMVVAIGCLPKGTEVRGGVVEVDTPFYLVLDGNKSMYDAMDDDSICASVEDVYKRIIKLRSERKGDTDGDR